MDPPLQTMHLQSYLATDKVPPISMTSNHAIFRLFLFPLLIGGPDTPYLTVSLLFLTRLSLKTFTKFPVISPKRSRKA